MTDVNDECKENVNESLAWGRHLMYNPIFDTFKIKKCSQSLL